MKKLIAASVFVFFIVGCGLKRTIQDTAQDLTNNTAALIDDAIDEITHESESWQATLQELSDKLTDEAQSTIRTEVENLATRTIAAAGSEIRCNVDFLGARVIQALQRIKAELLKKPVPERNPAICQVIPTAIDMNLTPNRRNKVDISGYDFDNQPLKLYMISSTNQITDVTYAINRLSHYHLVLNLGSNGVMLNETSSRLVLEYKNSQLSSIAVTQPVIPDCKEEEISFSPDVITFVPPHTRGDREYDGHGPNVTARVNVYVDNNTIKAKIYMRARETKSDWSTAEGSGVFTIYTAPSKKRILSIVSDKETNTNYIDSGHSEDFFEKGSGELVKRFAFVGDTDGDEAGTRTRVKVSFNRVVVKLKEIGNCKE
ncbi:hypothetical protein [Emticicia sp. BO119]|uniref:hypothetical protein n=1 Tax=Emticicia sp. BO119 TaxID=2757768 RepID=UPI0015F03567|nr:hypothetical protein [Emticicia sp. BO119]MBA4852986.1 hypothetical protein [Emticicia sp. BO119]